MDKIIIGKELVEIETNIEYKAIQIGYYGELYIENIMPNDYIVNKGNGKIIILKFNKKNEIIRSLFNYNGACKIHSAFLIDSENKKIYLEIESPSLKTWDLLNKTKDGSTKHQWDKLSDDYGNMVNTSRNDLIKSRNYGDTTEQVLVPKKLQKKDKNLTTLESVRDKVKIVKRTAKTSKIRTTGGY
tara:strand:- start:80 stop:637 length:558 start_codon:yes stop_codon:yes gene_type:complete